MLYNTSRCFKDNMNENVKNIGNVTTMLLLVVDVETSSQIRSGCFLLNELRKKVRLTHAIETAKVFLFCPTPKKTLCCVSEVVSSERPTKHLDVVCAVPCLRRKVLRRYSILTTLTEEMPV